MDQQKKVLNKYLRVEQYLKNMIQTGQIKEGDKLPSENEIVDKFDVSRHTVRRALIDLQKSGLIYKEQGKGTFCSHSENKITGKTVAVLTTYISDYIFPTIIRGIEEVLSEQGYTLLLFNTNNEKSKEAEYLKKIIDNDISGLIIEPTASALENTNSSLYKELIRKNMFYIMLNAKYDEFDCAYLIMDDIKGEYILTKYLLQLGHRKIAGIFKKDDMQGVNRYKGFLKALAEYNVELDGKFVGNYDTSNMSSYPYEFASSLLQANDRPTAFVCYNDQIACQVLQAIRDTNLRVPQDISVVGYDDSTLATASEIKLTTVKHPKSEMGRKAARMLINMIEGRVEKPFYVYDPEIIVRSSCKNL